MTTFKELGKVLSKTKSKARVEWIGHKEWVTFGAIRKLRVGQWFSADATRDSCLSKTISVSNVRRIGSLDKKLSEKEWEEMRSPITLPSVDLKDL